MPAPGASCGEHHHPIAWWHSDTSSDAGLRALLSPYFQVYLPYIDGSLFPELVALGATPGAAKRKIFSEDIVALRACDVLLIILNGRSVDEGAAFELGVAWSLGKPCYGFKDDFRQLTSTGDNPMIEGALDRVFHSFDEIQKWLGSLS
jgi:nucleoside 2-deoxyribosyltransferase